MLQQTRVETVTPYFERFLLKYPTPLALAEAPEDEVLSSWSGLGYYRRARLLHAGARAAAAASIPGDRAGLLGLPGIGPYTAGAIASIAFGEAVGLVDGNVARVFARLFAIEEDMKGRGLRLAEALAERLVHRERPGDWNQALMELGATVCTPRNPDCPGCPLAGSCRALAEGKTAALPILGKKTPPQRRRMQSLVVRRGGRVLLVRRASEGLFGGLWEPPSAEGGPEALADLVRRFVPAGSAAEVEKRGAVVHVLSHRRLAIDVHAVDLPARAANAKDAKGAKGAKGAKDLPEGYCAAELFEEATLGEGIGLATLARKVLAASVRASR